MRRIWLCADDYGIAPGVGAAIRELIARGRLNATSAMVVAPSFAAEAPPLATLAAERRAAIGLHVTLTGRFRPLTAFWPIADGAFPPLAAIARRAFLRRLDASALTAEVEAQLAAFTAAFGRAPDFVDGHQHVQLFPQIRDAVLDMVKRRAPAAWVRQCGSALPARVLLRDFKMLALSLLMETRRNCPMRPAGPRSRAPSRRKIGAFTTSRIVTSLTSTSSMTAPSTDSSAMPAA